MIIMNNEIDLDKEVIVKLEDMDDIELCRYTLDNMPINELTYQERILYLSVKDKLKECENSKIIKAHIVHRVSEGIGMKYPDKVGSLLLLFVEYGTTMWVKEGFILNYGDLNFNTPGIIQSIEVKPIVMSALETYILHRKNELLTYKE